MAKLYVTYKTAHVVFDTECGACSLPKFVKTSHAISCPDKESLLECARDLYGYDGINYLKLNYCGRLQKGTVVHSWEDYQRGNFWD